jgi:hypothetical protein
MKLKRKLKSFKKNFKRLKGISKLKKSEKNVKKRKL